MRLSTLGPHRSGVAGAPVVQVVEVLQVVHVNLNIGTSTSIWGCGGSGGSGVQVFQVVLVYLDIGTLHIGRKVLSAFHSPAVSEGNDESARSL